MGIIQSLLVLMVLIALGVGSRYLRIIKKDDTRVLTSFVYYFALPALLLVKISQINLLQLRPWLMIGSFAPILFISLLLLLFFLLRLISKDNFILLALSVVFGSNAFFGLAFFEYFQTGKYFDYAIVTAFLLGALGIVLSLLLFEFTRNRVSLTKICKDLLKNPLLIAIALGLVMSWIGFRDSFLHEALGYLGLAAPGIAIFSLGIFLYDHFSLKTIKKSLPLALFRIIILPAALLLIFSLSGFRGNFDLEQFLLLQTGMPAAVSLAIFAKRFDYRLEEITGMVTLTSLLSFVALGLLYWISLCIP